MHLLCPHCHRVVTVPEEAAGQVMPCPECGGPFTVPQPPPSAGQAKQRLWDRLAGLFSRRQAGQESQPPPAATASAAADKPSPEEPALMGPLTPRLVLPAHGQVVPWIAPACLVLMAVLVFFPWLASPLALEPFVFWQSGFGAAFGLSHPGLSHLSAAPWIILFLLALLAGVVTIVAGAVHDYVLPRLSVTVPPGLEAVLAARAYILGAASMLALLFLLAQMLVGFPAESYDFAAGSVPEWLEQQRETYGLLMRSLVRRTLWARLTVTLSVVSVLATLTQLWLERRGDQPPPRLVVEW